MRNKVGNTRLQNMAHLQMIILLLITTSAKGCDEKNCNYGTAIAGTTGAAITAIGGISCAVTFGIGCLVAAAGTIVTAGTTLGSKFCSECSETPSIPLEKLDKIMKEQKETFQKMSQSQINNWFSNDLQRHAWFHKLSSTQKTLVTGQMVSKLNQQKILKNLASLASTTQEIQKSVHMTQIISLYGDSISNLLSLRSLFNDMHKDELGGIIDDFNSDDFIKATNHFRYGSKRNVKDVMKMLTSGHPLKSQSLWEIDQSYCRKTNVDFFSSLLYSSFVYRRIALQMEGKSMSKREAQRFENDAEKVKRSYDKHCFCVDAVNEDSSSRCVLLVADNEGKDFYKVRTQERMITKNLKTTCSKTGMLTPCGKTYIQDSNLIVCINTYEFTNKGNGFTNYCSDGFCTLPLHYTDSLDRISKQLCQIWDSWDCPKLDSIFHQYGQHWLDWSAEVTAINSILYQDNPHEDHENKWSLCMTEKGVPKPTGFPWATKKDDTHDTYSSISECNIWLKDTLEYATCIRTLIG